MDSISDEPPVPSPCVRNCCLDDDDVCLGCHRTLAEIIAWGSAGNAERGAIRERAAVRAARRRGHLTTKDTKDTK